MSESSVARKKKQVTKAQRSDSEREQREWLASKISELTTSLPSVTPSQWAEQNRYLPQSASNISGPYSFDTTPFLREIVDCFGPESPVREAAVMKGIRLGLSTAGENIVGYLIDLQSSTKILWYTSTNDKASARLTGNLLPMIQQSGLAGRIRSNDDDNKRRTGKTLRKLEFAGGGDLNALGAENPANFREYGAKVIIRDEIDSWKDTVGKDGDPIVLSSGRAAGFEDSRKIFDISSPLIHETSKIQRQFKRGDQRYYHVNCLGCGHAQVLRFKHKPNKKNGIVGGLVWELHPETGRFVPDSVRYLCPECGHAHRNEDKTRLLSPEYGAEWVPTAVPEHPSIRSYHLSSLYSPVGMQSWEALVQQWLEAWDVEKGQPKDLALLQVFYNSVLGEPFAIRGEKLRFQTVSEHRRASYRLGEIPNKWATEHASSPIQLLTCAVDVHKDNLAVGVFGWTKGLRSFVIDYWRFQGECLDPDNPETWGRLADLIQGKIYTADDGKAYRIALTLIDSGYESDLVHSFVNGRSRVAAIRGDHSKSAVEAGRYFSPVKTRLGQPSFNVYVDAYKEKLHLALRRGWDRQGLMPEGHWSAPTDLPDNAIKELTVEKKVEEIDPKTKRRRGWKWDRGGDNVRNELWDLSIYNRAAVDMLAWEYCSHPKLKLPQVSWPEFWAFADRGAYFFQSKAA